MLAGARLLSRNPLAARVLVAPATALPLALSRRGPIRFIVSASVVQEQDIVLLRRINGQGHPILTNQLKSGHKLQTHFGSINESDIIGKSCLETVASSAGHAVRIHAPTLAEYVTLTPRKVTPVYPSDANLIVSLLDIHVTSRPSSGEESETVSPHFEILEAGTGHGSLTLHLARAIHAANPGPRESAPGDTQDEEWLRWKAKRQAVVHTVDRSSAFSKHARDVVSGFRRGIYAGNVDFHVGDVTQFISQRTRNGAAQAFSHIILDLPDVPNHLPGAARALHDGGMLVVFCPSVTQIAQCVAAIRAHDLPLAYTQVLELGSGISGGRQWDVRAAKIRNSDQESAKEAKATPGGSFWARARSSIATAMGFKVTNAKPAERWEMVCRPSVGHRVAGGGFVGVWRRRKLSSEREVPPENTSVQSKANESSR